jgi:DNA-binding IclR family transcriptional regulator
LAVLPEERVAAIVDRWGLPASTENTITDRDQLCEELVAVSERGYAIDDQEFAGGLRSVGMAVTDPLGSPIGGFSVPGPAYRLDDETMEKELSETLAGAIETFESAIEELWPTA